MFNSRHPGLRRAWEVGSEPQFLTPLPRFPRLRRLPRRVPEGLILSTGIANGEHRGAKGSQGHPKGAKGTQREPRAPQSEPNGTPKGAKATPEEPKGAQGHPKAGQRAPKRIQRKPKGHKATPKEAKTKDTQGKPKGEYISNSRSTAPADVMLE